MLSHLAWSTLAIWTERCLAICECVPQLGWNQADSLSETICNRQWHIQYASKVRFWVRESGEFLTSRIMSARPRTRLYIFWKNRSSKIRKQKPLPPSLHSQTCQQRKGQFLWSWQKLLLMISEVDFINGFSILYIQKCGVRAFPSPLSIWCSRNSCQTRRILSCVGIMPTALWSAKEFQVIKNGSTVPALQRMPKKMASESDRYTEGC